MSRNTQFDRQHKKGNTLLILISWLVLLYTPLTLASNELSATLGSTAIFSACTLLKGVLVLFYKKSIN